jgi:flagellar biosynthetic protein FliP
VPANVVATAPASASGQIGKVFGDLLTKENASSTTQALVLVTVLAVAPAVLIMISSFTRIIVVLGLLRQALATQQMPPNQVLFGLALFMTLAVMAPTYQGIQKEAISPYVSGKISQAQAVDVAEQGIRKFMINQMEAAGNSNDVYLFISKDLAANKDLTWGHVPTVSLIPAFVISELKVAFMIGFRIFLPFLIIDMLVASVLVSMGMLMVPPVLISLPFKLLLFVLADGWHLVVGTLMRSFA